jgi:hypothetical protein
MIKFFIRKKLRDRLVLVGSDAAKVHAAVPAARLPPSFAGTADVPRGALIDALEALEASRGSVGGFALPLRVDDPTGSKRRAEAAAAAAAAPVEAVADAAAAAEPAALPAGAEEATI